MHDQCNENLVDFRVEDRSELGECELSWGLVDQVGEKVASIHGQFVGEILERGVVDCLSSWTT